MNRRRFLSVASLALADTAVRSGHTSDSRVDSFPFNEVTIDQLQAAMSAGHTSSEDLTRKYLDRIDGIDRAGPTLHSVLELNPEALKIAKDLDAERHAQGPRSPLHGIPIFLKGSIDTADRMMTTAGSLALVGPPARRDATVVTRLRYAGAVILGKTNMSEWASHRSYRACSGWSAIGGQTLNPYALDRNPSGSSSGSAVATAANLCAASIATETDLSIVSPASANGIVGIKPTTGLTSRSGIAGTCRSHDTVGPHARTVRDAAVILNVLAGPDPLDPVTNESSDRVAPDYTMFLDANGLRAARVGVLRTAFSGFSPASDRILENAISVMANAGASIIDPADLPTAELIARDHSEAIMNSFEFREDLDQYLASRSGLKVASLADVIAFNNSRAAEELTFFGQELFHIAQSTFGRDRSEYEKARNTCYLLSREQGIDAALTKFNVQALVCPTGSPAWTTDPINGDHLTSPFPTPAGMAGYPTITVPAGLAFGLPVGISFIGAAYSEPTLLKFAYAFEQASKARRPPSFFPTAIQAQLP